MSTTLFFNMAQSFLLSFTAFFVALDIIGGVPMYISLTQHLNEVDRKRTVNTSMLVAFGVALVFWISGHFLLQYLGITLFDFRIAGGLVLLLLALADVASGPDRAQSSTGATGIVPLAVPLITGPAAIATIILQVGSRGYFIPLLAMTLNYVIAWFALSQCRRIQSVLGKDGTVVLSKIAALFLAAIAISMIRSGIFAAITDFNLNGN